MNCIKCGIITKNALCSKCLAEREKALEALEKNIKK